MKKLLILMDKTLYAVKAASAKYLSKIIDILVIIDSYI